MSMSVEMVLYNYKQKISRLLKEIDFVKDTLLKLLERIKAIDASGLCTQQINELMLELDKVIDEIENNNLLDGLSDEVHVELEKAKMIDNFLLRKVNDLSHLQRRAIELEKDAIELESKQRLKVMQSEANNNFDDLKNKIINSYEDTVNKSIVLNYFKNNADKLSNLSQQEIIDQISEEIKSYYNSKEFSQKQYVQRFLEQVAQEKYVAQETNSEILAFQAKEFKSVEELSEQATILQEKITQKQLDNTARHHSIMSIIKSIKKRSFIVDPNNIREIEENGEKVILIYAKKVTGQEAIFRVYLDGRFKYKFEGYEGHAHDTDDQPFLDELSMYDVSLSKEQNKTYDYPEKIAKEAKPTSESLAKGKKK